jgi:hypothetical protein
MNWSMAPRTKLTWCWETLRMSAVTISSVSESEAAKDSSLSMQSAEEAMLERDTARSPRETS